MRGLYLNTDKQALADSIAFFSDYNHHLTEKFAGHDIELVYSKFEWRDELPKVIIDVAQRVYCAGWFLYRGKRNNLKQLAEDYVRDGLQVFNRIDLGSFVIAIFNDAEVQVVADVVGLSTHYARTCDQLLQVAPGVKAFTPAGESNPLLVEARKAQGHLFGNYTIYDDIRRLEPGSATQKSGATQRYYQPCFDSPAEQLTEVPQIISQVMEYWPLEERVLAISGGLDSRLALSFQRFGFGYTYGPEKSGDHPVARQYADCFSRYHEFDFAEPTLLPEEQLICDSFFYGVSSWVPRLLTAYKYSNTQAGDAKALFDGYIGNIFQRGNYLKFRGVLGNFLKLFPVFYTLGLSAETILRRRYVALSEPALALLLEDFRTRTVDLAADDYQKVAYYELFYGRGGRYVVNGGNITAGQMFTTIPIFLYKPAFKIFMSQDFTDSVRYKLLRKIWQKTPKRFREVTSDAGGRSNDALLDHSSEKYILSGVSTLRARVCYLCSRIEKYKHSRINFVTSTQRHVGRHVT